MKGMWLGLVLITCLTNSQWSYADLFPYDISQDTLDNGLQVVTVPFDSPGIVSFFVVVRVGSREEVEDGVTGFAHFFEHCMFRGTARFPQKAYDQALQEMAAAGNANTWLDRTLYYFTGNADELERMFDLEADRFRNLKYSEHDFKTEAGAVLGEYTKNFASPFRQLNATLVETAFDKHTYKHTTMGFLADIKDMPNQYAYSKKFYDRFYRPEYCTVMVVGDAKHGEVMDLAEKYFGKWRKGNYKATIPAEPAQAAPRQAHVQHPGNTNMVALAFKGPAFSVDKKDKIALDLMMEIGFSETSDIYKKLVQEEKKVRFISPTSLDTRDPYLVGVIAQVYNEEDLIYVARHIQDTIETYQFRPVREEALKDLKSRLKYQMLGQMNTPFDVGNILAQYIWLTGDPTTINQHYALLESVKRDDILQAAVKYLVADRRTMVTLSSKESLQ